jgi:hypothetical protein
MAVDQSVDEKWQRARLFPVTGIGNPNRWNAKLTPTVSMGTAALRGR